jgi:hypothetical protein
LPRIVPPGVAGARHPGDAKLGSMLTAVLVAIGSVR